MRSGADAMVPRKLRALLLCLLPGVFVALSQSVGWTSRLVVAVASNEANSHAPTASEWANTTTIVSSDLAAEGADRKSTPKPSGGVARNETTTITVMVDLRAGWRDWGFSFFESNQLQQHGRHRYVVEWFHFTKDTARLERLAKDPSSGACLLVSNPKGLDEIRRKHAPHCRTWIINDELCEYDGDVRFYYNEKKPDQLFMPLGPRYDFARAYRDRLVEATGTPGTESSGAALPLLPASQRPYVFNAIFSKSTSPSRKDLKERLLLDPAPWIRDHPSDFFIQIPGKWRRQMHPKFHVNSTMYLEVLSKSLFTVAPFGHNPECFRMYEAVLAGSIPILVLGDEEYRTHACPNSLRPVLEQGDPPFVILSNWSELEPAVKGLLEEGSPALDARQEALQRWYAGFLRERVRALEDAVLGASTQ